MRRRRSALLGLLLVAACDSPTVPGRLEAYDFTQLISPPAVFHWPVGSTVSLYVEAADGSRDGLLEEAVERGMASWNEAVLYGEYRLERVAAPEGADVVVVWADADPHPVDTSGCPPDPGRGVTTFCLTDDGRNVREFPLPAGSDPSPVRFVVTIGIGEAGDPVTLDRIVAHELGHTLGIFGHPGDNRNLMHGGQLTTATPSPADRATVQVLYHTPPDIRP